MDSHRTNPSAVRVEQQNAVYSQGQSPASKLSIQTTIAGSMDRDYSPSTSGSPYSSRQSSSSDGAWEASSSTTVFVNDILYSTREIRAMADELDLAHRSGEFPATKFLNYNTQATVDDHRRLMELREATGSNKTAQASRLLVTLTRDIRERDDELEERLERQRALRQVDACIRSAQEEQRLYRIMQTALLQNTHVATRNDLQGVQDHINDMNAATREDLQTVQNNINDFYAATRDDIQVVQDNINNIHAATRDDIQVVQDNISNIHAATRDDLQTVQHTINSLRDAISQAPNTEMLEARFDLLNRQFQAANERNQEELMARCKEMNAIMRATLATVVQQTLAQSPRQPAEPKGWRSHIRKAAKKLKVLGSKKAVAVSQPLPSPMHSVPLIFLDESSMVRDS